MSLADWRRSKLTLLGVLADKEVEGHSLNICHLLLLTLATAVYIALLLPKVQYWYGDNSGSSFNCVSWAYVTALCITYVGLALLGMHYMKRCHSPIHTFVFECMLVHNATQCFMNLLSFSALLIHMPAVWDRTQQLSLSDNSVQLLIWLQYHCRQLQLMDTVFMVLRKKFYGGSSFLHLYLRVLNLGGWFIACRFASCRDAYIPALVSSACQGIVYGLYFCASVENCGNRSKVMSGTAKVAMVYNTQYVICALHAVVAATWGNFPLVLAALHLFAIGNGILLYTDFHSEQAQTHEHEPSAIEGDVSQDGQANPDSEPSRVVFSFDSCGWLMVYHFGVGTWLHEHLDLQDAEMKKNIGFSGSSGGSLIAAVLAAGVSPQSVFEDILQEVPACRRNPREMFPAVERALRKYVYPGAHKDASHRLRVLLTRVTVQPPFVMGEVMEEFPDNETAIEALCASCHVPVLAGMLPRRVGKRCYYDGLAWASRFFVPWRGAKGDHVIRISASGTPFSDVTIPAVPKWWSGLPPNQDILRGLFWWGYRDASNWFSNKPQSLPGCCSTPRCGYTDTTLPKTDIAKWHAARMLLPTKPADRSSLPPEDVITSANVCTLIRNAEEMALRECRLSKRVLAAVLVAAGAALISSLVPNSQMLG